MSSNQQWVRGAALIFVAVMFAGSCENGDVLAPTDSTMTVTAVPTNVVFAVEDTHKDVQISALVLAPGGYPQKGVAVTFSTIATAAEGTLRSGGAPVTTDNNSIAHDVLTLTALAPASIDITATSGSLTKTVTIAKTLGGIMPADGILRAYANPASLDLGGIECGTTTTATSTISATALNKAGVPLPGIAVTFSPSAGWVDPITAITDSTGVATTELTIGLNEASTTSTVTVASGTMTAATTYTKGTTAAGRPLLVSLVATPSQQASIGTLVTFDASGSSDPNTNCHITMYRWTITSDNPTDSAEVEEPLAVIYTRTYSTMQTLSVKLELTDDPHAVAGSTTYQAAKSIASYQIVTVVPAGAAPGPSSTGATTSAAGVARSAH